MVNSKPYIIDETVDFAVVYKPHCMHSLPMHSIPLKRESEKEDSTLLDWFLQQSFNGRRHHENAVNINLMHRLDFETQGLILIAKNEDSYIFFKASQDRGEFIKEYSAVSTNPAYMDLPGFPPPPVFDEHAPSLEDPLVIESYFRPYGQGRKQVRPVIEDGKKHKEIARDKNGFYRTEIVDIDGNTFTVRIKRGFRHQIRCHLCWIGHPIQNDPLYLMPDASVQGSLALCAHSIYIPNPVGRKQLEYKINK